MIFEEIHINDIDRWNLRMNYFQPEELDVYYKPEYFKTWLEEENADPVCIYSEIDNCKFLYPFFKKEICDYNLSESYYDIYSAYGYGGVVKQNFQINAVQQFNSEFNNWCIQNNIVAEFIRENPAVNKRDNFVRDADYLKVRTNVYLQANPDFKIQSKSRRYQINRALSNGLLVEVDNDLDSINKFIELYAKTSIRLRMSKEYLFGQEYFHNHKKYFLENTRLINIKYCDEIISSALFYNGYNKTVYHLGCSDFKFKNLYPNDLLFKAMIDESKNLSNSLLSLGGGTTNSDDDKLFEFKKRFGNDLRDVFIGTKIHNEEIYYWLCQQWKEKYPELTNQYDKMFLKYRFKE